MSLIDFMDESSEMYMEARDSDTQLQRMERKWDEIDNTKPKNPRELHTAMKKVNDITGKVNKIYDHDVKYNKKEAINTLNNFRNKTGDEYDNRRSKERYMHALDAMDRHDRRHPDRKLKEGVIEFI